MPGYEEDLFAGFTPPALAAYAAGAREARAFDYDQVAPEHLLIGLAQAETIAGSVLVALGADADKIRQAVIEISGRAYASAEARNGLEDLRPTLVLRRIISAARGEAARLEQNYVSTEHLLLALLAGSVGLSAGILEYLGLDLTKVRVSIEEQLATLGGTAGVPVTVGADAGVVAVPVAASSEVPTTTFADVEGADEAKQELRETIEFLRNPERFARFGARIPRGVIFYGPSGTGKTLMARAVAGEAGVPFLATSGSDFVELYVGQGAKRVRELFKKARRAGKAIIFIDEIDALARARGSGDDGGSREADQTLNALLTEMDGFAVNDQVVVMAATNRLDILDPAVLRPGRFTRHIEIPTPDLKARLAILRLHAVGKPLSDAVDLADLARRTVGWSGAELANVLNEAAILAVRRDGDAINADDIHGGWLKTRMGSGPQRSKQPRSRAMAAAHEIGHAICGHFGGAPNMVEEISLYRHGSAEAFTLLSDIDEPLQTSDELHGMLCTLLGGRAGEWMAFGETTGGISNDLEKANGIARQMVRALALAGAGDDVDEDGLAKADPIGLLIGNNIEGATAEAAIAATKALLETEYRRAIAMLRSHSDDFARACAYIFEQERMDRAQFEAILNGALIVGEPTLAAWHDICAQVRERNLVREVKVPVAALKTTRVRRPRKPPAVL